MRTRWAGIRDALLHIRRLREEGFSAEQACAHLEHQAERILGECEAEAAR